MARISLDLSKFKSSGIYTLEYDTSESITLTSQTIRLVVGFSRKGPFNAPVYIPDIKTAKQIFGDIDPLLERRGSFFHRSMFSCLRFGPIFALNLMPLNNGQDLGFPVDKVDYKPLSVDVQESNGDTAQYLYSAFFNKQRFWAPESDSLQAVVDSTLINKGKLLSFVNLSQKPISVIVRKANVKGFDITANEWYGPGNIPDFVKPYDFISDYFLDVILVEGNWTDYNTLSIDPIFSAYFDTNGIKKDKLDLFLSSSFAKTVGVFTGAILPDLVDGQNVNHFIETIINNTIASTGMLCSVNRDMLDDYANSTSKLDLVGHGLVSAVLGGNQSALDFLSYSMPIKQDYLYTSDSTFTTNSYTSGTSNDFPDISLESAYIGGNSGIFQNVLVIEKSTADSAKLTELKNGLVAGKSLLEGLDGVTATQMKVESVNETSTQLRIAYSHPTKASEPSKFSNIAVLNVNSGSQVIKITGDYASSGPSQLSAGQILLVQKPGFRKYFTIASVALSSGNTNVTVTETDFEGVDTTCTASAGVRSKINL